MASNTRPSFFLLLLLFSLLCWGRHTDRNHQQHHHHAGSHSFSKRQNAFNSSQVDADMQPLPSTNVSFFEHAPENFFMRQPWSAENVTEATLRQKFAPALDLVTTTAATSNDYTCSASKPCRANAACCNGVTGQCGFGPKYCGADVCISDCQSKAECGQYAADGKQECPLKVCCSEFGFCGTTSEFCGKGCQNNCGDPKPSGRRAKNPQSRVIAYYEAWSPSKACGNMEPEDIPVEGLTHLNFAFGYVSPNTYNIVPMDSRTPEELFTRVTSAKERNSKLKVFVALGGWTFSDNGTDTQAVFPTMVKTRPARSRFINNLVSFLSQYGFDGVDIDWEYPSAGDRGGTPDDTKNFVLLVQEMRAAFDSEGKDWGITFTIPTSYWYLRWFDVPGMAKYVDWINVMSYDLHGVWDKNNPIGSIINPHTNLTEIDEALKLLWRVGIEPEKIVLGVAFYGRSFQLADSSCTEPSCPFAGPAAKGICTGEEGILSYMEIESILKRTKAKPTYDKTAGVQYVVFNGNQWVSYDDVKTIQQKIDFARDKGLSGLMTWAIDLDDSKSTLLKTMTGKSFDSSKWSVSKALAMNSESSGSPSSYCKVTDCHKSGEMQCPNGYLFQTYIDGSGHPDSYDMSCRPGYQRSLCCRADHNPDRSQCKWSPCGWPCETGQTFITSDWVGDSPNKGCSPRTGNNFRNYCCKVDNMKQYFQSCQWTACDKNPKCGTGNQKEMTDELVTGYSYTEGIGYLCPSEFCQFSEQCNQKSAKFCCKPKKVKSCKWRGTPIAAGISSSRDTCYGNECEPGEIVFDRGMAGDDPDKPCWSTSPKVLCCKPGDDADDNFDIDPAHLVPQDLREGSDIEVGSHISADNPKTKEFFTFMSVIGNKQDVVSLDKRDGSHLEFFGCSPGTGRQTAKVVCSNTTEGSNCNDIHDGGLWGTVVRLPDGCGRSRWARAISLTEAADQTLPGHLKKRGMPSDAKVQELTFDYDFKNLKRAASKIAFRIDQSNLANYWANVVDSAAKRDGTSVDYLEREELREFFANQTDESGLHEKTPHELYGHLHKRWHGDDAGEFVEKATGGDAGGLFGAFDVSLVDLNHALHGNLQCEYGGSKYTAVATIDTKGKVTGKIKYGATMYGELWPNFSFRKSYIHMRGSLKGDFSLQVTSDNIWDYSSDNLEFLEQFAVTGTSYEIDGIGEIYMYAGVRGKAYAKGEWSGVINVPWKWETDVVTLTVPSNAKVEDSADFEKNGMGAGADITPRYALGNDKLQMTVSVKPYIGLGFAVGAGDPKKKQSSFGPIAGLEMETEIRSIFQVSHNSELKESCINVYGQVGVNGVAVAPLAGWLLGKDRTEYALYHSSLAEIHQQCFPTGEIGKRELPRGLAIAPDRSGDDYALTKRASDISCRSDKAKAETDTDCSKCLIDNGFASDLSPPDVVYDTDLCDATKRSTDEQLRPAKMAIFLRNDTTIDNATLHTHVDKRAVTISKIAKCQLQWSSAKYDSCAAFQKKNGKDYYDEFSQTSCVDFRTRPYDKSQRSLKGQYATEHVYELNFIKEFLEFLRNQVYHDEVKESSVYKGFSCSDLTSTFFLGTNGKRNIDLVMNELGNRDKTDRLAVLFKDINGMKFRALARDGKASIVAQGTWDKSTWREKYSLLKRAGGVAHYMLTSEISKMFVDTSNGVYDAMGKADGTAGWKLSARYALWMDHLIKAYNEGMKDFVKKRSQELYDAHQAGSATGFTTSEVNNLQRMAQSGNPNFNMWWSPSGLKK